MVADGARRRSSSVAPCCPPPIPPVSSPDRPPARSPGSAGCRAPQRCTSRAPRRALCRTTGRPLPTDDRHLDDRPPAPRRRHRRRLVAAAGVRPRRRPPPARPPLGRHQLLHEQRVTADELVAIERRLGHPARPGSGVFRRTLESLDGPRRTSPTRRSCSPTRSGGVAYRSSTRRRVIRRLRAGARPASTSPCRRSGGASSSTSIPSTGRSTGTPATPGDGANMHVVGVADRDGHRADMGDVEALADELVSLYRAASAASPSAS